MEFFFTSVKQFKLFELAQLLNAKLIGSPEVSINRLCTLKNAYSGGLSFYNNVNYLSDLQSTNASAILIEQSNVIKAKEGLNLLVVDNVHVSFALLSNLMYPSNYNTQPTISSNCFISNKAVLADKVSVGHFSVIEDNVKLGNNVFIGNNVTIYKNVEIGDNTVILSNSSIKYAKIGANCLIHEGVRIGVDGFGFAANPTGHIKIPQIGGVIIANDVEIGANCCIDRGALDNTSIGKGTKLDNLVHIAHNVIVGEHCFITAGAGLAGSCVIGDFTFIGGGAVIAPHVKIGSGKQIVALTGVIKDIEGEKTLAGIPAMGKADYFKLQVLLRKAIHSKKFQELLKD